VGLQVLHHRRLAFVIAQSFLLAGLWVQKRRKRSSRIAEAETEELDQFFNLSLELLCIANTDGYLSA